MDILNLEDERRRLFEMNVLADFNSPLPDYISRSNVVSQRKLVSALEQLEQAREALRLVRSIIADGSVTGFNCHSGDWTDRLFKSQAVTFEALNQQGDG